MKPVLQCRLALAFLLFTLLPLNAQILGDLKVAFIRISFPVGDYPGFTGSGNFEMVQNNICGDYTIDPAPHDLNYFNSHVEAVDRYFRSVSHGKFGLDLSQSIVFPIENEGSYVIQKPMNYYNELGKEDVHEKRITELLRDGAQAAFDIDQIDFSTFDLVAVIHPGVGQDFKLPFLDPTPEDIPSTFVDKNMVNTHLGGPIQIGSVSIPSGIIIPESQNHILMDSSIHDALTNPCNVQFSITGTWALMIGFAVGLPPLWDLETGLSGVGVFSLMDQGSNNGNGFIPVPPDAWTRIYAGWESATIVKYPGRITIQSGVENGIVRIPISDNEYYLIENRNNWFRDGVSIDSARYAVWEKTNKHPSTIEILFDSVGVKQNEYGVITDIPNYDLGLPGSGLLIWHIDEQKINEGINSFSINSDRKHRGVDLEEADGAQDIGYVSNLLTDPSSGYWGDMWFRENKEYFRANTEESMGFSSFTYPNTKSNSGANSGINISNISHAGTTMKFDFSSSYDVAYLTDKNKSILFQWDIDGDGDLDFVGEGDSLWWGDDLNDINAFYKNEGEDLQVCVVQNANPTALSIVKSVESNWMVEWFEFDLDLKSLSKKWDKSIPTTNSVKLFKAKDDEEIVIIQDGDSFFSVQKDNISSIEATPELFPISIDYDKWIYPFSLHLSYEKFPVITIGKTEAHFDNISLVDLNDAKLPEIIMVDDHGNVHVLTINSLYANGFPIQTNATGPILSMDLMDDHKQELVYQDFDGTIQIVDNEGVELAKIASTTPLKGLSNYKNKHAIITGDRVISFKENLDGNINEWQYVNSTPDRSSLLYAEEDNSKPVFLINKDQTYAYPNPSYSEDIIFRITVGEAEKINIHIFDLAGFPVQSLKKDMHTPYSPIPEDGPIPLNDVNEIKWDISNVESGVYLARVVVSNHADSEEKIIKVGVIK